VVLTRPQPGQEGRRQQATASSPANDYAPILARGDLSAAMSWSGDIAQLGQKQIHWNVPKDGGALWTDNMLNPERRQRLHRVGLHELLYDPKVRA